MTSDKTKPKPAPKPSAIPPRTVLRALPSGEIALEVGADGVYLQFNCDCLDALPYCKAACCCLPGIEVTSEELDRLPASIIPVRTEDTTDVRELPRRADGWCRLNDPSTRRCQCYTQRPLTCQQFHCTRGMDMRGWRLDLHRHFTRD